MAKFLWLLLIQAGLFANAVSCSAFSGLKPTEARLGHLDRATNPQPTDPAVLWKGDSNLLRRQAYNTLCGYWEGNISITSFNIQAANELH